MMKQDFLNTIMGDGDVTAKRRQSRTKDALYVQ